MSKCVQKVVDVLFLYLLSFFLPLSLYKQVNRSHFLKPNHDVIEGIFSHLILSISLFLSLFLSSLWISLEGLKYVNKLFCIPWIKLRCKWHFTATRRYSEWTYTLMYSHSYFPVKNLWCIFFTCCRCNFIRCVKWIVQGSHCWLNWWRKVYNLHSCRLKDRQREREREREFYFFPLLLMH